MGVADEIERLRKLHASGAMSDEEYSRAKAMVLGGKPAPAPPLASAVPMATAAPLATAVPAPAPAPVVVESKRRERPRRQGTPLAGRLPGLLSFVGLVGGGVLGYFDLGWIGAAVGAGSGLIVGALAGWILWLLLVVLVPSAALEGGRSDLGARIGGVIGLAFFLALAWEVYWLTNLLVLAGDGFIGVRLAQETEGMGREQARETLRSERWMVDGAVARPLRWLLTPSVARHNADTRELLTALTESAAPLDPGKPLAEQLPEATKRRLLEPGGPLAGGMADRPLSVLGISYRDHSEQEIKAILERTLILRHVAPDRIFP